MSKRAVRFEKRTGWRGNAAGGVSPKRQPHHADRRDVGAGTVRAANNGPGSTAGPARGPSQNAGQKHRPPRPRSERAVVFLTERINPECPYCHRKLPLVSMAKHQQREHPGQPVTASESPYG